MLPRSKFWSLLIPGLFLAWMTGPSARAAEPTGESAEMLRAWREGQRFRSVRTTASLRQSWVRAVTFAPAGRVLATGGSQQVCVWNGYDWSLLGQFKVETEVNWLAFSPDLRWLYVAGTASEGPGLLARFDWKTGKLDRRYPGPATPRCRVDLSADGQHLALAQASEGRVHVFETQSGRLVHSIESSRDRPAVSLGQDGRSIVWTRELPNGPAGNKEPGRSFQWVLATPGSADAPERDLTGRHLWQLSPTGRYLLSGMASYWDREGLSFRIHDASDLRELSRRHDIRFGSWLAFSGDGRRLIVASQDQEPDDELCQTLRGGVRFSLLSVPDLDVMHRWEVLGESGARLSSLALSPDGRILAAATSEHRWGPSLFDTSTGLRLLPPTGHTGRISSVHFLPDGRTLRSIDSDGVVCLWDLPSMRLKDRLSIPTQCAPLAARPGDGRFLLCRVPALSGRGRRPSLGLGIVDTSTGWLLSSVSTSWFETPQVLWLNDLQAFLVDRRRLMRIDCRTGDILDDRRLDRYGPARDPDRSEWQPEQLVLSWISRYSERGIYTGCRLDLDSGVQVADDIDLTPRSYRHYGTVPGGRWFYAADPDLVLIDRETFKVRARVPLGQGRIDTLAFTADGGCLAVACTDPEDQAPASGPRRSIRIHDTLTGRPLTVFAGAESITQLSLSSDGRRLAAVHEDDTIEVWDLSGLVRR